MWNIKLGAEDLLDLGPALVGGQREEVWKKPEPDQMEPFLDPCFFHSLYVLLDIESFNFLLAYPLK